MYKKYFKKDEFDVIWDRLWNESIPDDELNPKIEAKAKVFRHVLVDAMKEKSQNVSHPQKNTIRSKNTRVFLSLTFFGSLDKGVHILAREISEEICHNWKDEVTLDANPKLKVDFQKWQQHYSKYLQQLEEAKTQNKFSQQDFILNLKSWLSELTVILRERITFQNKEVEIVINSNDDIILRLPWHELEDDLFKNKECFGNSIISIGPKRLKTLPKKKQLKFSRIRMLVVFGDSNDIDTHFDKQTLQNLYSYLELKILTNPTKQELKDAIADKQAWNIFFYAGHSFDGDFKINKYENIDINDFQNCISQAISQGLQLVFFNSCDGLKLAQQLEDHNLPQTIVMRNNVPDKAAKVFLRVFLNQFVERGKSLYSSMLEARNELEDFEQKFPEIKSLPIIYKISNEKPLSWKDMQMPNWIKFPDQIKDNVIQFMNNKLESWKLFGKKEFQQKLILRIIMVSIIVILLITPYAFFQDKNLDKDSITSQIDQKSQKDESVIYSLNIQIDKQSQKDESYIYLLKALLSNKDYPNIDLFTFSTHGVLVNPEHRFEVSNNIIDLNFNFIHTITDKVFNCKLLINNKNEFACETKELSVNAVMTK